MGAPQEVRRFDARLRDARRGGAARDRGHEPRRLPGARTRRSGRRGSRPAPTAKGPPGAARTGVGRWQRDCGCNMGGGPGWNQAWRGPLRRGLDLIRDAAARFYEDAAGELLVDPWGARDAYGAVVDDPIPVRDRALARVRAAGAGRGGRGGARARAAAAGAAARDAAHVRELRLVLRRHRGPRGLAGHPDRRARAGSDAPGGRDAAHCARCSRRWPRGRATAPRPAPAPTSSASGQAPGDGQPRRRGRRPGGARLAAGVRRADRARVRRDALGASGGSGAGRCAAWRGRRARGSAGWGSTEELDFTAITAARRAVRGAGRRTAAVARRSGRRGAGDAGDGRAADAAAGVSARRRWRGWWRRRRARSRPTETPRPASPAGRCWRATSLILLGEGAATPGAESLQICGALFELLALPAGSPERRAIEERVWALLARGRPNAALRAFADKVGFARASRHVESGCRPLPDFAGREYSPARVGPECAPPAPVVVLASALVCAALSALGCGGTLQGDQAGRLGAAPGQRRALSERDGQGRGSRWAGWRWRTSASTKTRS